MTSLKEQFAKKKQEKKLKRIHPDTAIDQYNLAACYIKDGLEKNKELSFKWLKKAAEQGFAKAQFSLGYYFSEGIGVEKNSQQAFLWYKKAAEQNHPEAAYNLAIRYQKNDGIEKNDEDANKGIVEAQPELATHIPKNNTKNDDGFRSISIGNRGMNPNHQAFLWFEKAAAKQGMSEAQLQLGKYYLLGKGITHNFEEAMTWFKKSAQQNNPEAQLQISKLNEVIELEKKAENNDSDAQLELANIHGKKFHNPALAFKWYKRAAEQGNIEAQLDLAKSYDKGKGTPQDHRMAFYWFNKAAEQGDAEAQYNLAICYSKGEGVIQDYAKCLEWNEKAVSKGHSASKCNLAALYQKGNGVIQDYVKAFELCEQAAKEGVAKAQYDLAAFYYMEGHGVKQDYQKAIFWFEKAAEQGNVEAHYYLGLCYDQGKGVEQNNDLAFDNIDKARQLTDKAGEETLFTWLATDLLIKSKKYIEAEEYVDKLFTTGLEDVIHKQSLLSHIKMSKELEEAQEKLRELVQNTSHLAGNLLRPNTQEKIAKRLKNTEFTDESKKLYYASSDIRYVKQQFKLLEIMQSLTGSEAIRSQIKLDEVDKSSNQSISIEDILNLAAFRAIDKLFDTNEYSLNFARDTIGKKQGDFLRLSSEYQKYVLATDDENLSILSWCTENLRPITICYKCDDWKKIFFHNNSQSVALFFCYFFELLFNAFKYADHNEHDFLTITLGNEVISGNEFLTIIWTNPKSNQSSFGSNKGLNLSASYISLLNDDKHKEKSQEVISRNDNTFELITRIDRTIFNL